MSDELLELVLIEIVSWVESIVATLAMLAPNHIWTAYQNDGNKLKWSIDRVDLIVGDLVFKLRQTSIVA